MPQTVIKTNNKINTIGEQKANSWILMNLLSARISCACQRRRRVRVWHAGAFYARILGPISSTCTVQGKECWCKERSHVKEARMQVVSNVSLNKPRWPVYFQTKSTQLVQNKTTFIQVAVKSLHFKVLYYSDICLVHYRMNLQQSR